jgi:replication factor C subunit 2/4
MFTDLWVDKYKPKSLDEITGNKEIIERLKIISKSRNLPNMIFSGMSGTGKTSSALCLVKEIYGNNFMTRVIELNASDDLRKIDVVRDRIDNFVKKKCGDKIVIFDEADSMTNQVQHTLRSIMDRYYKTTRFILICNSLSNIIESILSRCLIVKFSKLQNNEIKDRLNLIIDEEKIEYTEKGIDAICLCSRGDMRMIINNIQAVHIGLGKVTEENVYKVVDIPHPKIVKDLIKICLQGDINQAIDMLSKMHISGYTPIDIIETIFNICSTTDLIPEIKKIKYIKKISECHIRIAEGLTTLNQLTGIIAELCSI